MITLDVKQLSDQVTPISFVIIKKNNKLEYYVQNIEFETCKIIPLYLSIKTENIKKNKNIFDVINFHNTLNISDSKSFNTLKNILQMSIENIDMDDFFTLKVTKALYIGVVSSDININNILYKISRNLSGIFIDGSSFTFLKGLYIPRFYESVIEIKKKKEISYISSFTKQLKEGKYEIKIYLEGNESSNISSSSFEHTEMTVTEGNVPLSNSLTFSLSELSYTMIWSNYYYYFSTLDEYTGSKLLFSNRYMPYYVHTTDTETILFPMVKGNTNERYFHLTETRFITKIEIKNKISPDNIISKRNINLYSGGSYYSYNITRNDLLKIDTTNYPYKNNIENTLKRLTYSDIYFSLIYIDDITSEFDLINKPIYKDILGVEYICNFEQINILNKDILIDTSTIQSSNINLLLDNLIQCSSRNTCILEITEQFTGFIHHGNFKGSKDSFLKTQVVPVDLHGIYRLGNESDNKKLYSLIKSYNLCPEYSVIQEGLTFLDDAFIYTFRNQKVINDDIIEEICNLPLYAVFKEIKGNIYIIITKFPRNALSEDDIPSNIIDILQLHKEVNVTTVTSVENESLKLKIESLFFEQKRTKQKYTLSNVESNGNVTLLNGDIKNIPGANYVLELHEKNNVSPDLYILSILS